MKQSKHRYLLTGYLCFLLILGLPLCLQADEVAGDAEYHYVRLDYEDHTVYTFWIPSGKIPKVEFKLIKGANVDFYILVEEEYYKYVEDLSFSHVVAKENTRRFDDGWGPYEDVEYYIVIDNKNNSRATDAVPEGRVFYDFEYSFEEHMDTDLLLWGFCLGGTIFVAILMAVIERIPKRISYVVRQPPFNPYEPPELQGFRYHPRSGTYRRRNP